MKMNNLIMTVFEEGVGNTHYHNRYFVPFVTKDEIEETYERYLNKTTLLNSGLPKGKNLIRIYNVEIAAMTEKEVEDYEFLKEVA